MRVNERMKKVFSILLCLCMVLQYVPTTAFAVTTAESGLCEHHAEHTAECGYAEAVAGSDCTHSHDELCGYAEAVAGADCTHVHDDACGYAEAVEALECHYECAECAAAAASEEPSEESSDPAPVCDCGTDDPAIHATTCAVYVAPENPVCSCAEACGVETQNFWCDVCGFDYSKCTGTDTAVQYDGGAIDLSTLTETYLISDSGEYTFIGSGNYGIKVESGNPTIVLNNASITVGEGSAIDVASGSNATIFVLGDNTIGTTKTEYSDVPCGGIFVAEGGTVNITSNGTDNILRAHGTLAAAIGGKYIHGSESYNAGSISISNVTVYAYTNNNYAAAIGAAGRGSCGTINITNAVVYAYGAGDRWTSAPGIGSACDHVGWAETIPVVTISGSEIHTFRYNPYSDYIGYLGDEMGEEGGYHATGSINCGEGGSVKSSTIYCYTGLDATTTDKVVKYGALGGLLKEDGTCEGEHSGGTQTCMGYKCANCGNWFGEKNDTHDWSNKDGICANGCELTCDHESYTEGVCDVCDYACTHTTEKDENKATCKHGDICDLCGTEYGNQDADNHTGTLGTPVPAEDGKHTATWSCCEATVTEEHTFENGKCTVCGAACTHSSFADGKCTACGIPVCSCTVKCGETVNTECTVCTAEGADLSAVCNGAEEPPVVATNNIDAAAMTPEELKAAVDAALAAGYTAITVNLAEDADAAMFSAITAALATTVDPSLDHYELVMNYSGTIDLTISGAKTVPECTFYVDEYVNENWRAGAALRSVTLTDATTIGESAFFSCAMTSFSAPNVIEIEGFALEGCMKLTDVYLPSVQTLGDAVFSDCYALKTISLPECIDLGNGVFNSCEALETVYAPKATNLGAIEFMLCTSLMKVTLGSVVSVNQIYESIDNGLFCLANDTKNIELILACDQKVLSFDSSTKYWTATEEAFDFGNTNDFMGYTFKSITMAHTPEADDGDCTTPILCSTCGEIAEEGKESHTTTEESNKATCTTKAVCDLCGTEYGEKDANNHTGTLGTPVPTEDDTQHIATWSCCEATVSEEHTLLTYSASGNVITGSCSKCPAVGTATITAGDTTYNGTAQETATVAYSAGWKGGELTVSYVNNVNAGTATASITIGEATASVEFTIAKAEIDGSTLINPEFAKGLVYNGTAQALVTKIGSVDGGYIVYSLSIDGEYTTTIPVATEAGNYRVYWTIECDENHYVDGTPGSSRVTIAKANPEYTVPTGLTATYGDTLASVELPTGWAWKDAETTFVGNAGTRTFKALYNPDSNNYNTVEADVTVEVAKADPEYTVPTGLTATYGDTLADVELPTGWAWNDAESTSVGNAGTRTFKALYNPDSNNYNTVEADITVEVAKALIDIYTDNLINPEFAEGLIYNGTAQALVTNSGSIDGGYIVFSLNPDGEYTTEIPVATEAGEYVVYYRIEGDENHYWEGSSAFEAVTIAKANPEYTVPTGLTATYGDTLANVELPTGWAWKDAETTSIGNAGTRTFKALYNPDSNNYNTVEADVTVEVAKANPEYTVPTGLTATYGDTLAKVELPTGWAWNDAESTSVGNAGTRTFKALYNPDSNNYNTVEADVTIEVAKAEIDGSTLINPEFAKGLVYNGTAQALVTKIGSVDGGYIVYSLSIDGEYTTTIPVATEAGTYRVYWTIECDENHYVDGTPGSSRVTIAAKAITVTADAVSKTYGDTDPTLTYKVEGLVNGDELTGELKRVAGENVGSYAIEQNTLTAGNNYSITYTGANLTINAKAITEADVELNGSLTYTGEEQTQPITVTEGITYEVSGNKATNVGTYELTVKGTGNYTGEVKLNWSIKEAAAVVGKAPTAKELTYTGTAQALVNAGTTADGKLVYSLSENGEFTESIPTGTNAGEYTVWYYVQGDANHSDTAKASVKVTIAKADPVIGTVGCDMALFDSTAASAVELTRTDMSVEGTLVLTDSELTAGEGTYNWKFTPKDTNNYNTITGTVVLNVTADVLEKIEASGTLEKDSYSYGDTFSIDGLTVTATYTTGATKDVTELVSFDNTLAVGQTSVKLTYQGKTCTVTGFTVAKKQLIISGMAWDIPENAVYNGTEYTATLNGTLPTGVVVTLSGDKATNAGNYTAKAVFSLAEGYSADNYEIVNGEDLTADWTIAKKNIVGAQITLGTALTYNGKQQTQAVASVKIDGLTVSYTVSGNTGTDAKDYTLTITGNGNFEGTETKEWSIAKKNISGATITLGDSLTYIGNEQTQEVADVKIGDLTVTYDVTANKQTNAGNYTLTVTGNGNFEGSVTADWSIAKAKLTITANNNSITYGDVPAANGVTGTGFVSSESIEDLSGELTYSYNYEQFGNVGTYKITPSGVTSNNYEITFADGTLTVDAKPITVTADAVSKTYGEADPALTYKVEGLVNGDELTGELKRVAGENVGDYAIEQNTLTAGDNYTITYTGANLTINAKAITATDVKLNGSLTYNGREQIQPIAVTEGITYGVSGNKATNAGAYELTVKGTGNYTGSVTLDWTIAKAKLTITADSKVIYIGEKLPTLTYTASGLVGGDKLTKEPVLTTNADADQAGSYTITAANADAGDNYTITYVSGSLTIMDKETEVETKIEQTELTEVPEGLKDTQFDTVEEIKEELISKILATSTGYSAENMVHYDVALHFSLDGGDSWILATEENFPTEGITVILPYPEGTNARDYEFVVSHMFTVTSQRLGTVAGEVEMPKVEETANGIRVTLNGLSPVTVAARYHDHTGGTATCTDKAICSICGTAYGELDASNHAGGTEVKNAKEATCGAEGYTGDTHCTGCSELVTKGTTIQATGEHTYGEWKVVKEATKTAKGEKQRTCSICGHVDSEEIPILSDIPATGDDSNIMLWGGTMVISLAALVVLLVESKKRRTAK